MVLNSGLFLFTIILSIVLSNGESIQIQDTLKSIESLDLVGKEIINIANKSILAYNNLTQEFGGGRSIFDGDGNGIIGVHGIIQLMKRAFYFLGNSRKSGVGKYGGDGGEMQGLVCLIAMLAIVSFLLFILQPHPKMKRMAPRRFRSVQSRYAYKPPSQWNSEGKHFSSTESRPMVVPVPVLHVPVPVPTAHDNTSTNTEEEVKKPRYRKTKGRSNYGKSETNTQTGYDEDKLTRDEILYILKTLDD